MGCVIQPGELGCLRIQAFGAGEWDLQGIPRGAGQTLWDALCISPRILPPKKREVENHIIPEDESLPPSCPIPLFKDYWRGRCCFGNTKLRSRFPSAFPGAEEVSGKSDTPGSLHPVMKWE